MAVRSWKGLFGQIGQATLNAFWGHFDLPGTPPDLRPSTIADAEQAVLAAEGQEKKNLDVVLRRVRAFGDDAGVRAMLLAARGELRAGIRAQFELMRSDAERALWFIIHHAQLVRDATVFLHADQGRSREPYVARFVSVPRPGMIAGAIDTGALEDALREVCTALGHSSDKFHLELYDRDLDLSGDVRALQFVLRRADREQTEDDWSDEEIAPRSRRSVRDYVVLFVPETGRIDIVAESGGAGLKRALADCFAETALGAKPPDAVERRAINLASLCQPRLFPVEAADRVVSVRLVQITVKRGEADTEVLKVEAKGQRSLWDIAGDFGADLTRGEVTHAVLEFLFSEGRGEPRKRTLTLSTEPSARFTKWEPVERETGERLLQRWRLAQ